MTDIPIIFSAPMICALRDDRKTQTRRLAWRCPCKPGAPKHVCGAGGYGGWQPSPWQKVKPRDRLWVREGVCMHRDGDIWQYLADGPNPDLEWWRSRPSIHMPRWASRLTLMVTATKIERLQDISAADSIAEGVECATCVAMGRSACQRLGCFASQAAFTELWCRLHGPDSWDANPEVVAITFKVHRCNIDAMKVAA